MGILSIEGGGPMSEKHFKVIVLGGGTAGLTILNKIAKSVPTDSIALIEPSTNHYYQPLYTLVGGGIVDLKECNGHTEDYIPDGVTWVKEYAESFQPEDNQITTKQGNILKYDYLIVCPGIQVNWDKVKGLKENLGKDGVCSNYSRETVEKTWEFIKNFKQGKALFTFPNTPIKCAGAPQKIMWLAEEWFRIQGIRDKCEVTYAAAGGAIFGIEKYKLALQKLVAERNIKELYHNNLIEIDAHRKIAIFENVETGEKTEKEYDLIHAVPPMSAPDFIRNSPIADDAGWVDVDKFTLQHNKYKNIFSLGDASSAPNSKTGAAVRKQAPVVYENLMSLMNNKELTAQYHGYASCPLVTGRSKCIMAEFGYDGKIMETFPFNQAQERTSMYMVKRYVIPFMYWNFMLKGHTG
jgi:sulfide:quinone oxidoreductase